MLFPFITFPEFWGNLLKVWECNFWVKRSQVFFNYFYSIILIKKFAFMFARNLYFSYRLIKIVHIFQGGTMSKGKYGQVGNMEFSMGNTKLPTSTMIFNMSSATGCPLKEECRFGQDGTCYALKAEIQYKRRCKAYRERQSSYWYSNSSNQIIKDIQTALKKHKGITAIRFNESGDMRDMSDFRKLNKIANSVSVPVYTYTHNREVISKITKKDVSENLSINISFPNSKKGFNTYCLDTDYSKNQKYITCPGSCKKCNLCVRSKGLKLSVKLH